MGAFYFIIGGKWGQMFFNWGHFFSWGQKIILGSRKSAIFGIIWTPGVLPSAETISERLKNKCKNILGFQFFRERVGFANLNYIVL